MKDGKCPRCNSATVYKKTNGMSLGGSGVHVYISSQMISKSVPVNYHLCTTCGYFEMFVEDKAKLEHVAKEAALSQPKGWEKVG